MPVLQYETRVSPEGFVTLPPEYYGHNVVVSVDEERNLPHEKISTKKKPRATPEEAREFMETCYGCLEGVSDGEFEQMKMERIQGR